MDRERFDALARLLAAPESRRGMLAAMASMAMAGGAPALSERGTAKGRKRDERCDLEVCLEEAATDDRVRCCKDGSCSCGGKCCGDRCFRWLDKGSNEVIAEACCGKPLRLGDSRKTRFVFCPDPAGGDPTCCPDAGPQSCEECLAPSGIAGSYRRPGR